jgi:adenosylcobinamide kinase / adenosylcobinamide-phosphate guanylyltransferase
MSRLILITGGARSGKSAYAQRLAEALPGPHAYLATCPAIDPEMSERIRKHRMERAKRDWQTLEEPYDLSGTLARAANYPTVLIDCLTLWINNLMFRAANAGTSLREEDIQQHCRAVVDAAQQHPGTVIFVSGEVGLGIVPDNREARLFRDLLGRCNQVIAGSAGQVTLVSCGLPLHLKQESSP